MEWIDRLKLKVFACLAAIVLATVAIAATGIVLWPVIGVAVAAAVVSVAKVAQRLDHPTCFSCGHDLSNEPIGEYGTACPVCGSIHQPRRNQIDRIALNPKKTTRKG